MSSCGVDRLTPSVTQHNKRCINCSFLIPRNLPIHSLEQASTSMINLLQSWITPTQLSSECVLCTECLTLLQDQANTISEGLPAFGHRSICFTCGNSILRATRTYPARQDRQERNILVRHVRLHQISRLERVCAACWRSATRELQRRDQQDSNRPGLSEAILPDVGSSSDLNIPELPPPPQQNLHTAHVRSNPTIRSSVYKRAARTSNHCIFVNCFETEHLLVPSSIKDLLLLNNKFYVPPAARICRHNLDHGRWSELTSQLKDFTGSQFDSIMRIMQRAAYYHIDFSNILIMPTYLCHFWLGMNSDQFYNLLNGIPSIAGQVPNATVALSIYLVKLRTGDSNERLATLFNKSHVTLERLMNKARTCLINEFVPLYLGFNHMNVEDVASRNRIIPEGLFEDPPEAMEYVRIAILIIHI
ncbi:unnamed protein product [Parnassius apollo]|uniref:(apollo) hypothetical protein n=1 Tax=Parnassius apollo TaxID=110799 RepID=A0A8S3WRN1_PARAO|nr:unnamed protein product [Parnassius apollo]